MTFVQEIAEYRYAHKTLRYKLLLKYLQKKNWSGIDEKKVIEHYGIGEHYYNVFDTIEHLKEFAHEYQYYINKQIELMHQASHSNE